MQLLRAKALPAMLVTAALALSAAFANQGCSFIVDSSAKQCSSDDDCRGRGPAFQDSFCSQTHVCVHAVDYCATNAECVARTGVNATICRKDTHKCVELASPQCKVLADNEDIADDNAVVMGVHGIPSWAPTTQSCENAVEMARKDFKQTSGGLPPSTTSNGKPRPVIWVSCDVPIGNQSLHKAVSDHLFKDINVVASIGPFATIDFTLYGLQSAIKSGSAMFTVSEDSDAYDLPDRKGLLFSFGLPLGAVTIGQVKGVEMLEQLMRSRGITRDLKLAYVYVSGIGFGDATQFAAQVRINGKTSQQNGDLFQSFTYGATTDPNFVANISSTVAKVQQFKPDIVVLRGSDEVANVATQIEAAIPDTVHFLLPIEARNGAVAFVGNNENLRRRVLGFQPGGWDGWPSTLAFNSRYKAEGNEAAPGPLTRGCFNLAYTMYYAAGAVVNEPLTGRAVGKVLLDKFQFEGTPIDTTPTSIAKAFNALQGGQNLKVTITGEQSDVFEPNTGFLRDWHLSYWCVAPFDYSDSLVSSGLLQLNITYSGLSGTLNNKIGGDMPQGCLK